jgi:hypothetical protein
MNRSNRLEKACDVTFIVACGVLSVLAAIRVTQRLTNVPAVENSLQGSVLRTAPLKCERSGQLTFVLVFSAACHHCVESMPFYSRLAGAIRRSHRRVRLLFASYDRREAIAPLLRAYGLAQETVVQVPEGVRLQGTPTLLVIDGSGEVLASWLGRMTTAQERSAMARASQF